MSKNDDRAAGLTRRQTLGLAGSAGAAFALSGVARGLPGLGEGEEALAKAARTCVRLTPETTEGPFYVDLGRLRRNIVDGSAGVPLRLRVRVLNPATCRAIAGAAVDVWHCNAAGTYSDEASEGSLGEEFLRGIQLTDEHGFAEFRTVYPGYYQGRATHIHVKVHIGGRRSGRVLTGGHVAHTGQIFFPESTSNRVYARSPYNQETAARVPNRSDQIYRQQGGSRALLRLKGRIGSNLAGTIALGVNPRATPAAV